MSLHPSSIAAVGAVLALAGSATAQGWDLPPRAVLEFDRVVHSWELRTGAMVSDFGRRVVRSALHGGHRWRVWQGDSAPPPGFEQPSFQDAAWPELTGGFGGIERLPIRSAWTSDQICVRTKFEWAHNTPVAGILTLWHDDDVRVFLNGTEVFAQRGARGYQNIALPAAALQAVSTGPNLLAIHCRNEAGARYLDAGLNLFHSAPCADTDELVGAISGDARHAERTLFADTRSPALVFAGELDDQQQVLLDTPRDLRDVAAYFALDLTKGGRSRTIKVTLPQLPGFGDLKVTGKAGSAGDSGEQVLQLTLHSCAPAVGRTDKRFHQAHVATRCDHTFDGVVTIQRSFDRDNGRVRAFRATLAGTIRRPQPTAKPVRLELIETWQLRQVRAGADAAFRAEVTTAIARSAEFLAAQLVDPAAAPIRNHNEAQRSYSTGRLALALVALMRAGYDRQAPVVVKAFDELRRREILDTYSLANAIMAVEARYAPSGEREDLLRGVIKAPRRRQPSAADREALLRWTEQLLGNHDTRVRDHDQFRFNYFPEARFDHSVNQYGLLGLYSAHLCGIPVPTTVWRGAAEFLVESQDKPSGKIKLALVGHAQLAESPNAVGKPRVTGIAGWAYHESRGADGIRAPHYGATTVASLTGLTLCQAALRELGQSKPSLDKQIDTAVDRGFAWLAANFSVRHHPGWIGRTFFYHYYYLYSLERACELSGVALVQGRDWYHEGAMALLDWQLPDGNFARDLHGGEPIERVAMAVLFLMKSALPVYTR